MRKVKVYGGLTFKNGKQIRTILAEKTRKRASEALGISLYELDKWWGETGNAIELATALASVGTVFIASTSMGKDFVEA